MLRRRRPTRVVLQARPAQRQAPPARPAGLWVRSMPKDTHEPGIGPESLPSISVVVPTHNRCAELAELLDALLWEPGAGEIVVVADACTDGTASMLAHRSAADPRVRPLLLHENVGQFAARRLGVERASQPFVLALDDDVVPEPGVVDGHRRRLAEQSGRIVIGYMPVAPPTRWRAASLAYSRDYEGRVEQWRQEGVDFRGFWAGHFSCRREEFLRAVPADSPRMPRHEDRVLGLAFARAGLHGVFDDRLRSTHRHQTAMANFVDQGFRSGRALKILHATYPEELGPLEPERLLAQASSPLRLLVAVAVQRPRLRACVLTGCSAAVRLLESMRLIAAAMRIGRIAWLIERQRGISHP